jgi:hypothetical protein
MVQMELNNMYISIGANNDSEVFWTKKDNATSGKLINPLNPEPTTNLEYTYQNKTPSLKSQIAKHVLASGS